MFRSMGVAAVLALGVIVAPASSAQQDEVSVAATKIYDSCRSNQKGSPAECSCVAGFYSGAMKEDEFRMMSAISIFIDKEGNVPDMAGAQAATEAERIKQGMSAERFAEVMNSFAVVGERGPYADRICGALANKSE